LRARIEHELFQKWANGKWSMQDTSRLVSALIDSLEEHASAIDDQIQKLQDKVRDAQARVQATGLEWSHIGVVRALLGKRTDVFNRQAENLSQWYIHRTRVEAFSYAKYLLQFLTTELNDLSNEVSRAASSIEEATKDFKSKIDARLADSGQDDLTKQVVRFYKPEVVKDFVKTLVRDKSLQLKQTAAVRQALLALLGENQTFAAFNARIPKEKFVEALEATCEANATDAHNEYVVQSKDRPRVLGVSVIERLSREYGGNPEALRSYVIGITSHAMNYLRFNGIEENKGGPGTGGAKVSALSIILPDSQELREFRDTLKNEFSQNVKIAAKELVSSTSRANEITLVTLTNSFPARYVEDVSFLKKRYFQRISGNDAEQAKFELHAEGDGSQLPDLYLPETDPKRYLANLLIANGMNAIQTWPDPDTGESGLYLLIKDERGLDTPMRLGKDFDDAWANPNADADDPLSMKITQALATEFLHQTKRDELFVKVMAEVEAIKAERKNPLDKAVRAYSEAARLADTILHQRG
jgi:hypothetical protein